MAGGVVGGYAGKILRVDLTHQRVTEEYLDESALRKWIGGVGIGAKYLYEEVPPGVSWHDPENRLIFSAGPMSGTRVGGSGTINVVTKGCLTNGATSTQANGFMGAYLKFSGYDAVVIQGAAREWQYLYIHDGTAELRDARRLIGKDVFETEALIKEELSCGRRTLSVHGIGPAGENLVRFAAICGDGGHVAGHNGAGAVMGSKRLKAIAAGRGNGVFLVHDPQTVSDLAKGIWEYVRNEKVFRWIFDWGTMGSYETAEAALLRGSLPVRNLTTNIFTGFGLFSGEHLRTRHEVKPSPCWACMQHHCHRLKLTSGRHSGLSTEEPEYELMAAWGPLIGNTDPDAAIMLSDLTDRLGLEGNEAGWLMAMIIELFERGVLTVRDTDGLEMRWGNVEAVEAMLHKIAGRHGLGDLLAEGVMRAAERLGSEALSCGVYVLKGVSPRGHDHRARWVEMFDTATSGTGTIQAGPLSAVTNPQEMGLVSNDPFSAVDVSTTVARTAGRRQLEDCIGACNFCSRVPLPQLSAVLNAITGWDITPQEAQEVGFRVANLLRAFNVRHGITPRVEVPSPRYWSAPVDGPAKGKSFAPVWDLAMDNYYKLMGWDRETGKPLPETLEKLGLENVAKDLS